MSGRYVTSTADTSPEPARLDSIAPDKHPYRLMRLCQCSFCGGAGRTLDAARCGRCRGEGRTLDEVSTQDTPQALGLALVTLAEEGEFDGCPIGVIGPNGWLVKPWLPSPRNVSDAGRVLAKSKGDKT